MTLFSMVQRSRTTLLLRSAREIVRIVRPLRGPRKGDLNGNSNISNTTAVTTTATPTTTTTTTTTTSNSNNNSILFYSIGIY
jgi:hypothetical protein